jgi:hypothetical protein
MKQEDQPISSGSTPNSLSAEAIVERLRAKGVELQIAPADHPIYQTGARVRLGPFIAPATETTTPPEETE